MALGDNIARLRRERGWTQVILAEKMDVNPNHVSRWERNRQRPSSRTLKRLAEELGVTLDDLLSKEQPPPDVMSMDLELREKFVMIQELSPEDRALVFRVIETFATRKRMEKLLGGA